MKSDYHLSKANNFLVYFTNLLIFVFATHFIAFVYFKEYMGFFYHFLGLTLVLLFKKTYNSKPKDLIKNSQIFLTSLYIFLAFPILAYYKYSASTLFWIFLIPTGLFVFYDKYIFLKALLFTSILSVLLIFVHYKISFLGNNTLSETHQIYGEYLSLFNIFILYVFLIGYNIYLTNSYKKNKWVASKQEELNILIQKQKNIDKELNILKVFLIKNQLYKNSELTINEFSRHIGKSYNEISKILKQSEINNFKTFVNTIRIDKIIEIIDRGELKTKTLKAIFTENGFANQSTFNRVFKEITGKTPSEYTKHL